MTDDRPEPTEPDYSRQVPFDEHAEQCVLGGLLLAPTYDLTAEELYRVQEVLSGPDDFYRPAHQVIYQAITALVDRREPADAISVNALLVKLGDATRVGGAAYLHTLTHVTPVAANAGYYAKIVADRAVLRRLVEVGTRIAQIGYQGEGDVAELADTARALVANKLSIADRSDVWRRITDPELVAHTVDSVTRPGARVPTGFAHLDELTGGGYQPGQLVVIGARPALGKSTLALTAARAAAKAGHRVGFIGLEMTDAESLMRFVAAESKLYLRRINAGDLSDEEWGRFHSTINDHADLDLFVTDRLATLSEVRAAARTLQMRHGPVGMLVVDYLQLVRDTSGRYSSPTDEVTEVSRQMKLLAKELGAVVVLLSQLNRGPEQRQDKRPVAADLRQSGAVEQDADMVILLHREDAYDRESPRAGEADLIVAKHRNGPTGEVTVAFHGHYGRFVDMPAQSYVPGGAS